MAIETNPVSGGNGSFGEHSPRTVVMPSAEIPQSAPTRESGLVIGVAARQNTPEITSPDERQAVVIPLFPDAEVISKKETLAPMYQFALNRLPFERERLVSEGMGEVGKYNLNGRGKEEVRLLAQDRSTLDPYYDRLGLHGITTTGELRETVSTISADFEAKTPVERIKFLVEMRHNNQIGLNLLSNANAYLHAEEAYQGNDFRPGTKPEHLSQNQLIDLETGSAGARSHPKRLPDAYGIPGLQSFLRRNGGDGDNTDITLDESKQAMAAHVDLPYQGILLHDALYEVMFNKLEEHAPKDLMTGATLIKKDDAPYQWLQPAAKVIEDLTEEIDHYSRPLPGPLAKWHDKGILNVYKVQTPAESDLPLSNKPDQLETVAKIFMGGDMEAYSSYNEHHKALSAEQTALIGYRSPDGDIAERQRRQDKIIELKEVRDHAMFELQKAFFGAAVTGFAAADQPLHPDAELKIKRIILNSISGGAGGRKIQPWIDAHMQEITADHSLNSFIPWLKRYAYEIGVHTEPLVAEMQKRCEAGNVDPRAVVDLIEEAIDKRKSVGFKYKPDFGETMNWFVEEALFSGLSTLDDNGDYTTNRAKHLPDIVRVKNASGLDRSPLVIENIVAQLMQQKER